MEGLPQFEYIQVDAKRSSAAYRIDDNLKESLKEIGTAHELVNSGDSISFLFQHYKYTQAKLRPFLQAVIAEKQQQETLYADYEKNYLLSKNDLSEKNRELSNLQAKYEDCKQNLETALAANATIELEPNQMVLTLSPEAKKAFMLLCRRAAEMGHEVDKEDPGTFINQILQQHCEVVEQSRSAQTAILNKLGNKS